MRLFAFDISLGRPGCAILQAHYGATDYRDLEIDFPAESWLLAPTDNLKLYPFDDVRYEQAKEVTRLVMGGMAVREAWIAVGALKPKEGDDD